MTSVPSDFRYERSTPLPDDLVDAIVVQRIVDDAAILLHHIAGGIDPEGLGKTAALVLDDSAEIVGAEDVAKKVGSAVNHVHAEVFGGDGLEELLGVALLDQKLPEGRVMARLGGVIDLVARIALHCFVPRHIYSRAKAAGGRRQPAAVAPDGEP